MTDTTYARELLHDAFPVAPGRNVKAAIGQAFRALERHERRLPAEVLEERNRRWTERRVRALWGRDARRVDHYEIEDLTAVAVQEARSERQRLKAREQRLAALIAALDTAETGPLGQQMGRSSGRLDMSRTGGEQFPAEDQDQSINW